MSIWSIDNGRDDEAVLVDEDNPWHKGPKRRDILTDFQLVK
jgi:hypothetical protein